MNLLFINNKYIGFLRFNEKNNTNELVLMNKETNAKFIAFDLNVHNYYRIDDNTIGIISINSNKK